MSRSFEKIVLLIASSIVLTLILRWLAPFIGPFVLGLMLAALIDAPVSRLCRLGVARGVSVGVVLGCAVVTTVGSVTLVLAQLLRDLERLANHLPRLGTFLQESLTGWVDQVNGFTAGLPTPAVDLLRHLGTKLTATAEVVLRSLFTGLSGLPSMFSAFAVSILAAFFLSRDGRKLSQAVLKNLPPSWRGRTARLNREIFGGLVGFVRAQMLLVALSSFLSTVALLVFRVPYAWLLGAAAGVLDIIPFIGPSGIFIPVILGQWVVGNQATAIGLCAAWTLVLGIRQLCEPSLVGSQSGLHPLTTLLAVYIGVRAFGVVGLAAGPLLAVTAKSVWLGALRPMWFNDAG